MNLEPGKSYRIEAHKAGYRNAGKAVTIVSGQEQTITLKLQANLGEVAIRTQPEGVTVATTQGGGHPAVADTGTDRIRMVNVTASAITFAGTATFACRLIPPAAAQRGGVFSSSRSASTSTRSPKRNGR